ncbi:MAG: C39 family peptidase [Candidatus Kerfeldbacteria bacterium]|nr:C39 family peptidase [Candidatus Kerfeldbacteria bacterium]
MSYIRPRVILIALVAGISLVGWACQSSRSIVPASQVPASSPAAAPVNEPIKAAGESVKQPVDSVPKAPPSIVLPPQPSSHRLKVLPVPFTVQAPYADWSLPYQEACEEASMVMAGEYFKGNKTLRLEPAYANQEILKLVEWQKENRGFYEDTTAAEVASILKDYYGLVARVEPYDPEVIKLSVASGQLVLVPAAGRLLGNPYFRRPGPLYHMLVIKGYDGDEFITNDPGTKRGESFRYQESALARAVHDWNGGDVEHGGQVMVIVSKSKE